MHAYLDYNASTPVLPRVREAVLHAMTEGFGNPSAGHAYGKRSRAIVERARGQVAALLGCDPDEILFTGGGTESNNLALRGVEASLLVTSQIENPATLEPASALRRAGLLVIEVPPEKTGAVDPAAIEQAFSRAPAGGTCLVSIMLAQN